jgi:hypothetical protein
VRDLVVGLDDAWLSKEALSDRSMGKLCDRVDKWVTIFTAIITDEQVDEQDLQLAFQPLYPLPASICATQ